MRKPIVQLPGNATQPATVIIGTPRLFKALQDPRLSQRAWSTTAKVMLLDGEQALLLPRAWLSHFWPFANGTLLARASGAPGTFPEMVAAEDGAADAFASVKRWRRLATAWQASPALRAAVNYGKKPPQYRANEVPIPRGRYDIDAGRAKARGFTYDLYRFVRAGETPAPVSFGKGTPPPPPQASPERVRAARKLRFVSSEEAALVFGDRERLARWTGIFDERGGNAFAAGEPCDYDLVCDAKRGSIEGGRVIVLDGPTVSTWLATPGGGVIVRMSDVDDKAVAAAAAMGLLTSELRWKQTKLAVVVGAAGARLMDSTSSARMAKPRPWLDVALAPGRYAIERAEHDGATLVNGKRSSYMLELLRLRRA